MIDWDSDAMSITMQAELLELNRTSLYYQPVLVSAEELAIAMLCIDNIASTKCIPPIPSSARARSRGC